MPPVAPAAPPRAYLDHNATTPPLPEVTEAVTQALVATWANPSSLHAAGRAARASVDAARRAVARLAGVGPTTVVFTSGGTESNVLALRGALRGGGLTRLVISRVEHPSVLETAAQLEREGVPVARIGVSTEGQLDRAAWRRALEGPPALCSLLWANNETGVLFPIAELAAEARAAGHCFHTDAVQAAGRLPLAVVAGSVDLLSLSAHKLHGPKGIGALLVRGGVRLGSLLPGGGQEQGRRGGTENGPGIAGFGAAALAAVRDLAADAARMADLRDRLQADVLALAPFAVVTAAGAPRLPNTLHVCFPGHAGESLLLALSRRGVAVSTGSACAAGAHAESHVLRAMGLPPRLAAGALRFSLARTTGEDEIDRAREALREALRRAR